MMDFNRTASGSERLTALLDAALRASHTRQASRTYLGASRWGGSCERALQYEYTQTPIDPGREIDGRLLRIFARGHVMEGCMLSWLQEARFEVRNTDREGNPFGFSLLEGRLQGHADGVILDGPEGFAYPCLWENKCLGSKYWRELEKRRLAVSKPIYAAQVAVYQAYLELHEHPALFTAVNADTMEIYAEQVPFDAPLAQRMSDRAVKVIAATDAHELLPRAFTDPAHLDCRWCAWQDRCWRVPA